MIPSLAPCLTGIFLWYKDGLALPGEHAPSLSGRDLLDESILEDLLSRFARSHPGGDRRALASMWSQWHFGALIIPTTAAILQLDRDLPVELDRIGIVLHDDGRTATIILPHDGGHRPSGTSSRFARLFDGHVEPLIDHLAYQFGVSRRLLWTNAATIFDWTLQQASALDKADPAALSDGRSLLESRTDGKGRLHPMSGALQYRDHDGEPVKKRKVCCLRYLLPGIEDCGTLCPIPMGKRCATDSLS